MSGGITGKVMNCGSTIRLRWFLLLSIRLDGALSCKSLSNMVLILISFSAVYESLVCVDFIDQVRF